MTTEKKAVFDGGIEYWDLDTTQNEEVRVLQPNLTWEHFKGSRYPIQEVRFEGTPEVVASLVQAVRDKLEWGNHIVVQGARCGVRGEGKVLLLLKMYATNIPYGEGPLQRVDRMVLRIIGDILVRTARDVEDVLIDIVSKKMTKELREQKDEEFLQRLENTIKMVRMVRDK